MKSYCFTTLIEYLGFSSRSPRKVKSKEKATRKFFSHAFLCFISGEAAGNNGCGNLQPSKRREQKNLTREINIIKDFIPSSASFFQFKARFSCRLRDATTKIQFHKSFSFLVLPIISNELSDYNGIVERDELHKL